MLQIKNIAADPSRTQKLFDGGGLFLEVTPKGSKRWRLKYRFNGKEKLISLGTYPNTSLKEAREQRDVAKKLLQSAEDPSEARKNARKVRTAETQNCFETVAQDWIDRNKDVWATSHTKTIRLRLNNDVLPYIGKRGLEELGPTDLLEVLRRIEERGAVETAHRVRICMGQIFRFAIASGKLKSDPSRDLRGALKPSKSKHLAALTEPKDVARLLRMVEGYRGGDVVRSALQLAPLVFVRPGELRSAQWKDIYFQDAEWRFLASKTQTPHIVPLSSQAIKILEALKPLTGLGQYVFPNPRTRERPLSDNAILAALRGMGIPKEEMCGHGFRAMARTMLDEKLGYPAYLIEQQLAHSVKDSLGRAYNRTKHLPERKAMMQRWADYLSEIKNALQS